MTNLPYVDQRLKKYSWPDGFLYSDYCGPSTADRKGLPEEWKGRHKFFWQGKDDSINILYLSIYGAIQSYTQESGKKTNFLRWRINPALTRSDQKYSQPSKSGWHLFFLPNTISAYEKAERIDTLYLIEGEFKAFSLYAHGHGRIHVVGMSSYEGFHEKGETDFPWDLKEIIRVCKPDNLVLILDADARTPKWENWNREPEYDYEKSRMKYGEHYDLGEKQNNFFHAVKKFRDIAMRYVKDSFYAQPLDEFLKHRISETDSEKVKGVDDLLLHFAGNEQKVIEDLEALSGAKKYFTCRNIGQESPEFLRKLFFVKRTKDKLPEDFYNHFSAKLGGKEFVFMANKYRYDEVKEELILTRHEDTTRYVRIGVNYFKILRTPQLIRKKLEYRRVIEPWSKTEIHEDYIKKGHKDFIDHIEKYDTVTNVPENGPEYKQEYSKDGTRAYNMYYRVEHIPEEGKFKSIKLFLSHVFGVQLDVAYDYLKLIYTDPSQRLPILALVSEERSTGKSLFLELCREMFGENATILGNDAISDTYNDDYSTKLIIGIDEGLIEKQAVVEKIKHWSTATRISMSTKFLSRKEIPFYGKVVITSNNVNNFIKIEEKEKRFWIIEVPTVKHEDPELINKMVDEIPAFFHFLKTREMAFPNTTRQWFSDEVIATHALNRIKDSSQSWLIKELRIRLQEEFMRVQYHTLCYSVKELSDMLNTGAGMKFRMGDISDQVRDFWGIHTRLMRYLVADPPSDLPGPRGVEEKRNRVMLFKIEKFLSHDDIAAIGYRKEIIDQMDDLNRALILAWGEGVPELNFTKEPF